MQPQVAGQPPRRPEHQPVDEEPQAAEGTEVRQERDELEQQPERRVQSPQDHRHHDQLHEGPAVDTGNDEGCHQKADGGEEEPKQGGHAGTSRPTEGNGGKQ